MIRGLIQIRSVNNHGFYLFYREIGAAALFIVEKLRARKKRGARDW